MGIEFPLHDDRRQCRIAEDLKPGFLWRRRRGNQSRAKYWAPCIAEADYRFGSASPPSCQRIAASRNPQASVARKSAEQFPRRTAARSISGDSPIRTPISHEEPGQRSMTAPSDPNEALKVLKKCRYVRNPTEAKIHRNAPNAEPGVTQCHCRAFKSGPK